MERVPEGWGGVDLDASVTLLSPPPPSFPSRPPPSSLVPQLRARDPASRGDRYMLVTYDEPPYCIKVKGPSRGWAGREAGAGRPDQPSPPAPARGGPASPGGAGGAEWGRGREEWCLRGFGGAAAPGVGEEGGGRAVPGRKRRGARPVAATGAAASEDGGHFAFV